MEGTKVFLVEDDAPTRARLAHAVEVDPALELAGTAGGLREALDRLEGDAPHVLLVDLGLPDGSGIDLIREVRRRGSSCEIMVITVFDDETHVLAAIEAGATGYVLKDVSEEDLGRSIAELLAGGSPISPSIARHLLRRFRPDPGRAAGNASEKTPRLSEREHEVLVYLVKGFTFAEIAGLLGISAHTVASHVKHIYRKLEVCSRAEAVYESLQLGLLDDDV